jgi:hypothetical protein
MPPVDHSLFFAARDSSRDAVRDDEDLAALTRCIELRVAMWRSILSYVPGVAPICALARRTLPPELCPDAVLLHLSATTRALEACDSDPVRAAYVAARRVAAERLGSADPDLLLCDSILADITSIELGDPVGLALDVELPPQALPCFAHYAKTVRLHRQALHAAREALIAGDVRVVAFALAMRSGGPPFVELVEAGNCGLRQAIGRFVPRRGVRFSTCATWWIRRSLRRSLLQFRYGAGATVPPLLAAWQIQHAVREFMALHGRDPIDDELVGLTGLPLARIREVRRSGAVGDQPDRAS